MSHLSGVMGQPGASVETGHRNPGQWQEVTGMWAWLQYCCPSAPDLGSYRAE